jgi:hypothetical protein
MLERRNPPVRACRGRHAAQERESKNLMRSGIEYDEFGAEDPTAEYVA